MSGRCWRVLGWFGRNPGFSEVGWGEGSRAGVHGVGGVWGGVVAWGCGGVGWEMGVGWDGVRYGNRMGWGWDGIWE